MVLSRSSSSRGGGSIRLGMSPSGVQTTATCMRWMTSPTMKIYSRRRAYARRTTPLTRTFITTDDQPIVQVCNDNARSLSLSLARSRFCLVSSRRVMPVNHARNFTSGPAQCTGVTFPRLICVKTRAGLNAAHGKPSMFSFCLSVVDPFTISQKTHWPSVSERGSRLTFGTFYFRNDKMQITNNLFYFYGSSWTPWAPPVYSPKLIPHKVYSTS